MMFDKENIEALNLTPALEVFNAMRAGNKTVRDYANKIDVVFDGYEEDSREVYSVPEVRLFVKKLTQKFPFWLHYCTKESEGLKTILFCLMPIITVNVVDGKSYTEIDSTELNKVVLELFGFMNQLYAEWGFSAEENSRTTHAVAAYLQMYCGMHT